MEPSSKVQGEISFLQEDKKKYNFDIEELSDENQKKILGSKVGKEINFEVKEFFKEE